MLTDEKIIEIADEFIDMLGYDPCDNGIHEDNVQKFARKIEKEILENLRKHKVGIELEFDCDACGCTMVVDI